MMNLNHRHWRWGLVLTCLSSVLFGALLTQPTRAAEPIVVNAEGYTTRNYGSVSFEGINYAVQSNVANEYVPSMTHSYSDMGSYYLVNSDHSLPNVPNITTGVLWSTGNKNRGWAINSEYDIRALVQANGGLYAPYQTMPGYQLGPWNASTPCCGWTLQRNTTGFYIQADGKVRVPKTPAAAQQTWDANQSLTAINTTNDIVAVTDVMFPGDEDYYAGNTYLPRSAGVLTAKYKHYDNRNTHIYWGLKGQHVREVEDWEADAPGGSKRKIYTGGFKIDESDNGQVWAGISHGNEFVDLNLQPSVTAQQLYKVELWIQRPTGMEYWGGLSYQQGADGKWRAFGDGSHVTNWGNGTFGLVATAYRNRNERLLLVYRALPGGDNPPTPTPPPPPPSNAASFNLINRSSGLCLDVAGANAADGSKVQQWTCNNTPAQQWELRLAESGYYQLVSKATGKCLDLAAWSTADGGIAHQWSCGNNQANQQWNFQTVSDGWLRIANRNSSKFLSIVYGSLETGAATHQWPWQGNPDQQWRIQPVGTLRIANKNSNKCIDVANNNSADGTNILQWPCYDGLAQQWQFQHSDNGYYKLRHPSSGKMLSVSGDSSADGANIHIWTAVSNSSQQWRLELLEDGFMRFINRATGKVVDVAGGSNADNANIQQWTWNSSNAQRFKLTN
ncbi:RICIN domain-containing protein [Herpetosiphon gulosus]